MNEICGDNRFEIIAKAKAHLLDATNIDTSEDEMKVLDNFLFRCWQMGWLDRYADRKTEPQTCEECEHWNDTEDGCADRHGCKTETNCSEKPNNCETCKHNKLEWYSEICDSCCGNNNHYEPKDEPQTNYDKGLQLFADILFDKEKNEQFLKECKAMGIEPQTEESQTERS